MASVLEIFQFHFADISSRESTVDEALRLTKNTEGVMKAWRGTEVEDLNIGYIFRAWRSLDDRQRFEDSPVCTAEMATIRQCITGPRSVARVYHNLKPATLASPIIQILRARLNPPEDMNRRTFQETIRHIIERFDGKAFGGPTIEDSNLYFIFIGTEVLQRNDVNEPGICASRELTALATVELKHIWIKPCWSTI